MATATWSTLSTEESVTVTGLNSLATATASSILEDIDNTTAKALYVTFWLQLGSFTPSAGGQIVVRLRRKYGSDYEEATATIWACESRAQPVSTTTAAKYLSFERMSLGGPFTYGIDVVNNSGASLASSGHAMYYQTFGETIT